MSQSAIARDAEPGDDRDDRGDLAAVVGDDRREELRVEELPLRRAGQSAGTATARARTAFTTASAIVQRADEVDDDREDRLRAP